METEGKKKRGNKGGPLLIAKTPKELVELIGENTPVLVSKKSIVDIQTKNVRSEVAASLE